MWTHEYFCSNQAKSLFEWMTKLFHRDWCPRENLGILTAGGIGSRHRKCRFGVREMLTRWLKKNLGRRAPCVGWFGLARCP